MVAHMYGYISMFLYRDGRMLGVRECTDEFKQELFSLNEIKGGWINLLEGGWGGKLCQTQLGGSSHIQFLYPF